MKEFIDEGRFVPSKDSNDDNLGRNPDEGASDSIESLEDVNAETPYEKAAREDDGKWPSERDAA